MNEININNIEKIYKKFLSNNEKVGYYLNPDKKFTKDLIKGLLLNEKRYGYQSCPCRLASGIRSEDIDIICPCDYRDPDLNEFGVCFCALYVTQDIIMGKKEIKPIPERRPIKDERDKIKMKNSNRVSKDLSKPVWRCKVCGYLCGRDDPPEICPICKVKKDRFERFM